MYIRTMYDAFYAMHINSDGKRIEARQRNLARHVGVYVSLWVRVWFRANLSL